jgi:3-(3-hydroxy-phenyl)propionate hydroxylase
MRRAQVIVSGASFAGIVAAYRLAQQGVDVLLLEATYEPPKSNRAWTLAPATLEMIEELGWLDDLLAQGVKAPVYQHRNVRSGEILSVDFGEMADELRHPYRLHCEQERLIGLAMRKLTSQPNAQVRFQNRVADIEQDDHGVTVYVETAYGIDTFRADYLIVSDGDNVAGLRLLGARLEGITWPSQYMVISTPYPIERHFDDFAHVTHVTTGFDWCWALRTASAWHVVTPIDNDHGETSASVAHGSAFERIFGIDNAGVLEQRRVYRVQQRVADRYNLGRVLLMGDGAHKNMPLGGRGLNAGVHDAWNLVEKLDGVINHGAGRGEALSLYDRQRRTPMQNFLTAQILRKRIAFAGPGKQDYSEAALAAVVRDDAKRRSYLRDQAMIGASAREMQPV